MGDALGEGLGDGDALGDGEGDGLGDGDGLGRSGGSLVLEAVGFGAAEVGAGSVGFTEGVGDGVGSAEGVRLGDLVATGELVPVGSIGGGPMVIPPVGRVAPSSSLACSSSSGVEGMAVYWDPERSTTVGLPFSHGMGSVN